MKLYFLRLFLTTQPESTPRIVEGTAPDAMSDSSVTVRTKKFITNRLLQRRQFVSQRQTLRSRGCRAPRRAHREAPLFWKCQSACCQQSAWLVQSADVLRSASPQVVEVIHPGLAGVSKSDLKEKVAKMYTVRNPWPARACR